MRFFVLLLSLTLAALAAWIAVVFTGTVNAWGRDRLAPAGNAAAFMDAARRELGAGGAAHRGNAAFQLIEDGKVYGEYFVSPSRRVDADTLFQVASVSKWVTAWAVLALADEGKLDLDAPVAKYLKRWTLPESGFDNEQVTARRLLSHTAGLTDGLGYAGFAPGTEPQTVEDSLTRAADASPGADGRARVGSPPGARWRYSGASYTLLQLLIEEVTGASFQSYMQRAVFHPLGMARSTFVIDDGDSNIADSYDVDGTLAPRYRFTALAAASLYTSASDMSRFIAAHVTGPNGEPAGRGVLRPETLRLMRQPHASQWGADIWGLGTILYAPHDGDFIIGHDGKNEPAINAAVRLNPKTGDGIVILSTGDPLLATRLAGEWVLWKTGTIDLLMFQMVARKMSTVMAAGALFIVVAAIVVGWRRWSGWRKSIEQA